MKHIAMFLLVFFLAMPMHSQNVQPTENDTIAWMQSAVGSKDWSGRNIGELLDAFARNNVKIQYLRVSGTSPWIDYMALDKNVQLKM